MRSQRGYSQQKKVDRYLGLLGDLYSTMLLIYGLTVHLTWIISWLQQMWRRKQLMKKWIVMSWRSII